jgi:ATP-dependent Clp protease ATP-binding subunit ClpA
MFERFTGAARQTVVRAQEEARSMRHGYVGPEHLLLGLLAVDGTGASVAGDLGLDYRAARAAVLRYVGQHDIDQDALASIGIDLDAIRQRVEEQFGPGALSRPGSDDPARTGRLPLVPRAKKVLELSLREALHLKHNYIGTEHLLLGLLREGHGLAARVLAEAGVTHGAAAAEITTRLARS